MLSEHLMQNLVNINQIPKIRKNCNNIDSEVIQALLHGNWSDKEILEYICESKLVTYSTVRYSVAKLLKKYNSSSRSELCRSLIKTKMVTIVFNEKAKEQQQKLV